MKSAKSFRVSCSGGCGRQVFRKIGECRKCRRARLHEGQKRIKAIGKMATPRPQPKPYVWTRKKPRRENITNDAPLAKIWGKP